MSYVWQLSCLGWDCKLLSNADFDLRHYSKVLSRFFPDLSHYTVWFPGPTQVGLWFSRELVFAHYPFDLLVHSLTVSSVGMSEPEERILGWLMTSSLTQCYWLQPLVSDHWSCTFSYGRFRLYSSLWSHSLSYPDWVYLPSYFHACFVYPLHSDSLPSRFS